MPNKESPLLLSTGEAARPAAPELRLAAAVLESAVADATRPWRSDHKAQAVEWFGAHEPKRVMSFHWVCEALDMCPIRIKRMIDDHVSRGEPLLVFKQGMHKQKSA